MLKKIIQGLTPKITSRRERMTYWMLAIGVFMFTLCVIFGVPLLEAAPFYGAISLVAGWYLQKETDKSSIKEM